MDRGFPGAAHVHHASRRLLADRAGGFDVVHDNQSLGTGLLEIAAAGLPVVATVHHPITRDRVGSGSRALVAKAVAVRGIGTAF